MGDNGEEALTFGEGGVDMLQTFEGHPSVHIVPIYEGNLEKIRRHQSQMTVGPFGDVHDFLQVLFRKGPPEIVEGNEALLGRGVIEKAKQSPEEPSAECQGYRLEQEDNYGRGFFFLHLGMSLMRAPKKASSPGSMRSPILNTWILR